jgi:hypothetical protein
VFVKTPFSGSRRPSTTKVFIEELLSGKLSPDHPDYKDDYAAWRNSYDSLKQWEKLEQQYHEAFRMMKI